MNGIDFFFSLWNIQFSIISLAFKLLEEKCSEAPKWVNKLSSYNVEKLNLAILRSKERERERKRVRGKEINWKTAEKWKRLSLESRKFSIRLFILHHKVSYWRDFHYFGISFHFVQWFQTFAHFHVGMCFFLCVNEPMSTLCVTIPFIALISLVCTCS